MQGSGYSDRARFLNDYRLVPIPIRARISNLFTPALSSSIWTKQKKGLFVLRRMVSAPCTRESTLFRLSHFRLYLGV